MNGDLIKRWNIKVGPNDDVYILGDMFFKHQDIQQVKDVLNKLNGKKHLIRGNHDKFLNSINWKEYFEEVVHYKEISDDNRMVILFHYPIEEWNGYYRNSYMLYGHVHENMKDIKKSNVVVGQVDMFNMKGTAIATELEKLDLNGVTPIDALNILYRLKEKL
jgi:calcineurin-like phosphoesterase family protein